MMKGLLAAISDGKSLNSLRSFDSRTVASIGSLLTFRLFSGRSVVSYCVWEAGANALLPVTQKVVFMREGPGAVVMGVREKSSRPSTV